MKGKNELYILLHTVFSTIVLFFPAFLACLLPHFGFPYADSGFAGFAKADFANDGAAWFPILNFVSNAYCSWQFDPWIAYLTAPFGYECFIAFFVAILSLGNFVLLLELESGESTLSLRPPFASFLLTMALLFFFGFDSVILPSLCFLPWLTVILLRLKTKHTTRLLLALFATSVLMSRSAHQFAVLPALGSLFLAWKNIATLPRRLLVLTVISLVLPSVHAYILAPFPHFASYPSNGYLAPALGTTDGLRPMLGPEPPLPIVNQVYLRRLFAAPALALLFGIIGLRFIFLREKHDITAVQQRCFIGSLVLILCLIFDSTLVPEGLAQIAPLQTLRRLLPGYSSVSLAPFAFGFASLFLFLGLATLRGQRFIYFMSLLAFVVINPLADEPRLSPPMLAEKADFRPWNELQQHQLRPDREKIVALLTSPSYPLFKTLGLSLLKLREREAKAPALINLNQLKPLLAASAHEELLSLVNDGNDQTRWSTQTSGQRGTEWIHFFFRKPFLHGGIILSPGVYQSDYPRGLEISVSDECDKHPESSTGFSEHYRTIYRSLPWRGAVLFTSDGYPYYGQPQNVTIFYPERIKPRCILVRQIGTDSHFDWSIAEIKLID